MPGALTRSALSKENERYSSRDRVAEQLLAYGPTASTKKTLAELPTPTLN